MTIEIARLTDGQLALISDQPFPASVKHIEYFKEQRLFQLIFTDPEADDMLVTCEIDAKDVQTVESAPDIMVVVTAAAGTAPYGYDVPLIQIGV